jgi:hypothetical protein
MSFEAVVAAVDAMLVIVSMAAVVWCVSVRGVCLG